MAGIIQIGNFKMEWGKSSVGPTYDLKSPGNFNIPDPLDFSGQSVSVMKGLRVPSVFTCLNVRSRTIASLPINIIREKNGRKDVLTDHPAYYPLAHEPNSYMSSAQMFLTSMLHSDGWGNSVIAIIRDGLSRPVGFQIIQPGDWNVTLVDDKAFYNIRGLQYEARDVLHFRWFSLDGIMGVSPIRWNAMTIGKAIKQEKYSAYALGSRPPGYLSNENPILKPEVQAQNRENWKAAQVTGDIPVMIGSWKWNQTIIPPGDAEYLGTANLTERQIYGIYQLPPAFAQNYDRMTWNNAEQADLVYAKHTITPIVRVIEQECNMKLFTEREKKNTFVKFNMNGLLRGDLKARAEFYTAMRNIAGINGNEIREKEDMNPYPGGDIFTIQGANVPIDQLREFYSKKVAPTAPTQPTQRNGIHVN